jgi:hypothetical protein
MNQNVQSRYWLPYNFTLCKDKSSTIILEKAWVLTEANFNYIVLCLAALSDTPSMKSTTDRTKDYTRIPSANVELLMQYISATLFHMLLHVYFKLQSEPIILSFLFLPY